MLFTDQLGNKLDISIPPKRIVSLVPSQSEFLWDLGLRSELVGITKFCIHPNEMHSSVERIGGTKQIDIYKIKALNPDLIIGNKEENVKEQINELSEEFNVWMSDVNSLNDTFDMMESLGFICGKEELALKMVMQIKMELNEIRGIFKGKKVAYFIWNDPYMTAGGNTFINSVLDFLGFENVFQKRERYPQTSLEELRQLQPELCFLSSEPFPFSEKHRNELQKQLPGSRVMLADGEMFSWYGSHLQKLKDYVLNLKKEIGD